MFLMNIIKILYLEHSTQFPIEVKLQQINIGKVKSDLMTDKK